MNKKILIWLVLVVMILVSIIIDYQGYDIDESDLNQVVNNVLSNITYPEDADYVIKDQYEKGRIHFYSGQVYNTENRGPFIIGFKKHWLLPKYDNCSHHLRYTSDYISKPGENIDTYLFRNKAYQVDDSHILKVEREFNYFSIFQCCILIGAVLFGRRKAKDRINNQKIK